jgi:hypothetical protein
MLAKEEMNISGLCSEYGAADEYIIAIVKRDTDKEVYKKTKKSVEN